MVDAAVTPCARRTVQPLWLVIARLAVQSLYGGAVGAEYRLQPEVNKGLQAREALFPLEKGGMGTGLKPLNHFRLKAVL